MYSANKCVALLGLFVTVAAAPTRQASAAEPIAPTATERANLQLVRQLLDALTVDSPDPRKIVAYLADDCDVRFSEKESPAVGKAAALDKIKGIFPPGRKYKVEIFGVFNKGPIVVTSRSDYPITGGKVGKPFDVVGVFVVEKGKVKSWNDYVDTERASQ